MALIISLSVSLFGCRPGQDPADFSITSAPINGLDLSFETLMNNPVEIQYEVDRSDESNTVEAVMVTKPKNGELTACQNTKGLWKCIYIPKQDFVGEDFMEFKTRDGDFESAQLAILKIRVLQYEYTNESRKIVIPSKVSTVCDPLSGGGQAEQGKGLVGNIRLLHDPSHRENRTYLSNYLDDTLSYQVPNMTLFMGKVDVPSRDFTLGFSTQDNEILSVNEQPLIEFFNINLESILRIDNESEVGEYELAIISDDGSKLSLKPAGQNGFLTYINSNRPHAPTMLCGESGTNVPRYISFQKGKGVDIKINYFQGPRTRIALQFIWRKKTMNQVKSSKCGEGINSLSFGDLISSEGWSIIPADVFNLPNGIVNTCVDGTSAEDYTVSRFNVPAPKDKLINGLVQNVGVTIKNVADGSMLTLASDEFVVSNGEVIGDRVHYEVEFSSAISRDSDREVIIKFDQRIQE